MELLREQVALLEAKLGGGPAPSRTHAQVTDCSRCCVHGFATATSMTPLQHTCTHACLQHTLALIHTCSLLSITHTHTDTTLWPEGACEAPSMPTPQP